ncbi:MAG: acetyl-CoA carboxylase biotin carboxylase subunit family protein [Oligoflexales bacterium]
MPYVWIVGYRKALAEALSAMDIPYSVWSQKPLKAAPPGVDKVFVSELPRHRDKIITQLEAMKVRRKPTHVIAGTEEAVFPSAIIRRFFGARQSAQSILMRCSDKVAMKQYLRKYDVPMTKFVVREPNANLTAGQLEKNLGLPVVLKSRIGSGGKNLVISRTRQQIDELMDGYQLFERFVDAPEGSIESFVHEGKILFTNVTDYHTKKHINVVPAGYAKETLEKIQALNEKVISALKIKWGMTHLEFYLSKDHILFGEIALRPPGGYIMDLLKLAYKFDPWHAYVQTELGSDMVLPAKNSCIACSVVLHPGEGDIVQVAKPTRETCPTLKRAKIKARVGDRLKKRQSVGQDVGYLFLSSEKRADIMKDLRFLEKNPVFGIATIASEKRLPKLPGKPILPKWRHKPQLT